MKTCLLDCEKSGSKYKCSNEGSTYKFHHSSVDTSHSLSRSDRELYNAKEEVFSVDLAIEDIPFILSVEKVTSLW